MLVLSFAIDTEHYVLAAKQIIEILPLTALKKLPQAPGYVAGLLDYRGSPIPVIDLCQLIIQRPTRKVLSSRIIVVDYRDAQQKSHQLGIIGEKVTETFNLADNEFKTTGVTLNAAPYLGPVANLQQQMIQYIEINSLLTEEVQQMLFQDQNTSMQVAN